MQLLLNLLITGLAVIITSYLLPGVHTDSFGVAILVAIVLGIVNIFIKPILVILTLPITVLSLGLFIFIINALMVLLVDSLLSGFAVNGFWWALLFSLVLSLVNTFLSSLKKT